MATVTLQSVQRNGNIIQATGIVDGVAVSVGVDITQITATPNKQQFIAQALVNAKAQLPTDFSNTIPLGTVIV